MSAGRRGREVGGERRIDRPSLKVLVLEDDFYLAETLSDDIRSCGDTVVGPFADMDEAIRHVAAAQVAILDVRIRDLASFPVADSLVLGRVPFVFLTGYDNDIFPDRFAGRPVYQKPHHARTLLDDLHRQYEDGRGAARPDRDGSTDAVSGGHPGGRMDDAQSLEAVVSGLLQRARTLLPDPGAAERLVEATLRRAITEARSGRAGSPDPAAWLHAALEDEFRRRGRLYLH
ncbi:response regulator receiver protein [Tistrella mobilis]|uniref:response regulator receiver protein n=1 Tax=Tistrella mobilis TaxID=171437 RepID=UPI00355606B6